MEAKYVEEQDAVRVMEELGVCKEGIEIMEPRSKYRLIYLTDIRNSIANILKQEMLYFGGDVAVHEGCVNCTVDKSNVLIMGTMEQIHKLISAMQNQVSESHDIAEEIEILIGENEKSKN